MFRIAPHYRRQEWIAAHGIFAEGKVGSGRYDESVVSLSA